MTDAQGLLVVLGLIYLSECLVWLRRDCIAVVIPLRGRAFVRRPSSWAGNDSGGFAFTTLLPARAVFVCDASRIGRFDLGQRHKEVLASTRFLYVVGFLVLIALFVIAPAITAQYGFERVGLLVIFAFVALNVITALFFFATHRRVDRAERGHRWTHFIVMLVATPSTTRAVEQVTRNALREFDALAVAARITGEDDPTLRVLLRELAHPLGGEAPDAHYKAARKAGLQHRDEPPARMNDAATWCPRCLAQYGAGPEICADCEIALRQHISAATLTSSCESRQ